MTKEEIAGGLKQALLKGENLEKAKQSFINAGYSREEVEEASRSLSGTISNLYKSEIQKPKFSAQKPHPTPSQLYKSQFQQKPNPNQPAYASPISTIPKKRKSRLIIILAALLSIAFLVLLAILVGLIFYKEPTKDLLITIYDFLRNLL